MPNDIPERGPDQLPPENALYEGYNQSFDRKKVPLPDKRPIPKDESDQDRAVRERLDRIDEINAYFRALALTQLIVNHDCSDQELERAEKILVNHEISLSVPVGTPARDHVIRRRVIEHSAKNAHLSPFKKLRDLLTRANELENSAQLAKSQSDAAIERAVVIQTQYDELQAKLSLARKDFDLAKFLYDGFVALHASLDESEAVADRFVKFAGGDRRYQSGQPTELVRLIDNERLALAAVISDWPRVEKVLLARIDKIQSEIAKLEM